MSDEKARKPLAVEDVATLMALKSQMQSYMSAMDALRDMHNTVVENMRTRYNAPEQAGWQLNDYVLGFVQEPMPTQDHEHGHSHSH